MTNANTETTSIFRRTVEGVTTRFGMYFLLVMTLLSGLLFIAGMVMLGIGSEATREWPDTSIPDSWFLVGTGLMGFCLFCPWYTAVFFARHLLDSVKSLEERNKRLEDQVEALARQTANPRMEADSPKPSEETE